MLVDRVQKLILDNHLWRQDARVLIAVSTGVDSMVLLHVLQQLTKTGLSIGVAHINHQLRESSIKEAAFLADYCKREAIPFYSTRWEVPEKGNIENRARQFRYRFFKEIMETQGYDVLVTGHHADDQVETMLMKMVRTGALFASQGILLSQSFGSGRLVRPFLYESKEALYAYAEAQGLVYFEDESNQTLQYQRNRFRHQVLPVFKEENAQSVTHFQQLSEQIQEVGDWLGQQQAQWFSQNVTVTKEEFHIDLAWYHQASVFERKYFLHEMTHQAQKQWQLVISKKQIEKVSALLEENLSPQWQVTLEKNWSFIRRYETLYLKKIPEVAPEKSQPQTLHPGECFFLSEHQWIGLFPVGEEKIPEKVKLWSEFRQDFFVESGVPLTLRKKQPGDRIELSEELSKKVARYFIDQKIPTEARENAWLILNKNEKIIGILPYLLSYLSIGSETDKIHYILLFKYEE